MKCLSIRQPFPYLIMSQQKTIELRDWKTKHEGWILLCVSQKPFDGQFIVPSGPHKGKIDTAERLNGELENYDSLYLGQAIGLFKVRKCLPMTEADIQGSCQPFNAKKYSWHLQSITPLLETFPVKGKLSLFDIALTPTQNRIIRQAIGFKAAKFHAHNWLQNICYLDGHEALYSKGLKQEIICKSHRQNATIKIKQLQNNQYKFEWSTESGYKINRELNFPIPCLFSNDFQKDVFYSNLAAFIHVECSKVSDKLKNTGSLFLTK